MGPVEKTVSNIKPYVCLIPVYRAFDAQELFALHFAHSVLSKNVDFKILTENIDLAEQFSFDHDVVIPPRNSLSSILAYNNLLLNSEFYDLLSSYKKLIILQHDVLLFNDFLSDYEHASYVGPRYSKPKIVNSFWFGRFPRIGHALSRFGIGSIMKYGNGGFSIRDIDYCAKNCPKILSNGNLSYSISGSQIIGIREDIYWSWVTAKDFGQLDNRLIDKIGLDYPSSDIKFQEFNKIMSIHGAKYSNPQLYELGLKFIGYK